MTSGSNKHNSSAKFRHNTSLTSGKLVVGSLFGLPKNFPRGKLRKRSQIRNYLLHRECSEGEAAVYKRLLDRDDLRQPNARGVDYCKTTLRPHFVKGAQTVFLYRFMKFMKNNRGNGDLMKTRFQIDGRRLAEAWMDLLPELDLTTPVIQSEVTRQRNAHNQAQAL